MTIDAVLALKPAPPVVNYFDGVTGRKRNVVLDFGVDLRILDDGEVVATWPYADIRRSDAPPELLRLSAVSAPALARLETRDSTLQYEIKVRCRRLDSDGRSSGMTGRIVAWSLAAAVSIVLVTIYGVPVMADRLAPLLPSPLERRLGQAAENQARLLFANRLCTGAQGQAAFDKLVGALRAAAGLTGPVQAVVADSRMENAFALPGGKIYLLDGLLQKANSADEIAGVIGHELGHVRNHDSVRVLLQNGGTAFLLGLFFGDVSGSGAVIFATRTMFDVSFNRDAEQAADMTAIDIMHRLGRSPKPMGQLLFRITGAEKDKSFSFLSNHPLTEDRLTLMTMEDRPNTGPDLLTAEEWKALKSICTSGP